MRHGLDRNQDSKADMARRHESVRSVYDPRQGPAPWSKLKIVRLTTASTRRTQSGRRHAISAGEFALKNPLRDVARNSRDARGKKLFAAIDAGLIVDDLAVVHLT